MGKPPTPADENARGVSEEDLRAWMTQYGPALRRYFQKRVSTAEAEDLAQDVFVAMQVRGETASIENVEGYLFRTAAHILARRYRKPDWDWSRRESFDEAVELPEHLSPERILIAKEDLEFVITAIESLPTRMGEAFAMHRFGEMSYVTIARRMGVRTRTVENLVARAVRRLIEVARARQ